MYSHRAVVCRCTVPEEEDDDEGMNSLCRQIVGTDKNLDISTLITRGCFFGTYYLTASTLPLGLATTWWIWTLPTCFPTALCMCMVWWKCRYSQPGRFEWLCKDFFLQHLLLRLMWWHQFSSDCFFFWQVSARMSRFSGWLCCLIQVDLPCIFFHRSTLGWGYPHITLTRLDWAQIWARVYNVDDSEPSSP